MHRLKFALSIPFIFVGLAISWYFVASFHSLDGLDILFLTSLVFVAFLIGILFLRSGVRRLKTTVSTNGDNSSNKHSSPGVKSLCTRLIDSVTSEKEISDKYRKFMSLLLSGFAIIFGSLYYEWPFRVFWFNPLFFLSGKSTSFHLPSFIHGLCGLLMCFPLYCRDIIPFRSFSPYYCLSLIFNILLTAVLAQFILGPSVGVTFNILSSLLILGIVVLWLGMRSIAGLAWLLIACLATFRILDANLGLRHWGLLFMLCSFLSIFFQAHLFPKDLFQTIKYEFRGIKDSDALGSIKSSIQTIPAEVSSRWGL
jgi:hypothetical protein